MRFSLLFALAALSLSLCPVNVAAQAEFSSSDAFVKSILKGEDSLTAQAIGDLNGDGLSDWVGVIHREKPAFTSTSQLFVLLQLRQGGYRLAEQSREEQFGGMECCWVEDLRISRSSIFIQNNAKTAATMEAATHQFKLHQDQWRLIGVRVYYLDHGKDTSTDTDMNLLTGVVIEKRQTGERKPRMRKWSKKFGRHYLRDFDFFNGFGIA